MSAFPFTIAPMTLAHVDACVDIELRSNSHPWTALNFSDSISARDYALVALNSAQVLGFIIIRSVLDEAELLLTAVDPKHRRQGIAGALLQSACAHLKSIGVKVLHLEVRSSNQAAKALYAAKGFTLSGLRKNYYPSGSHSAEREDALLMKANL